MKVFRFRDLLISDITACDDGRDYVIENDAGKSLLSTVLSVLPSLSQTPSVLKLILMFLFNVSIHVDGQVCLFRSSFIYVRISVFKVRYLEFASITPSDPINLVYCSLFCAEYHNQCFNGNGRRSLFVKCNLNQFSLVTCFILYLQSFNYSCYLHFRLS